jgi:hypothetical protein
MFPIILFLLLAIFSNILAVSGCLERLLLRDARPPWLDEASESQRTAGDGDNVWIFEICTHNPAQTYMYEILTKYLLMKIN